MFHRRLFYFSLLLIISKIRSYLEENNKNIILDEAIEEIEETRKEVGMTIESIDNIDVAYKLKNMYGIEMPIVEAVYNVLYNGLKPKKAVKDLMTRDKKFE